MSFLSIELNTFTLSVKDTFEIKQGLVVIAYIENGTVYQGDAVDVNGKKDVIAAMESNGKILRFAEEGTLISILLKDISKNDVAVGDSIFSD